MDPGSGIKTKRKSAHIPSIDMTPMVDLGFLLITFFIFTTSLGEKKSLSLVMPADGDPTLTAQSKSLTVLLDRNNNVYTYEGMWEEALAKGAVNRMQFSADGLRRAIQRKQENLLARGGREEKLDLVLLIKPGGRSSYKNVIDALDEAAINRVAKYSIVDITAEEEQFLQAAN